VNGSQRRTNFGLVSVGGDSTRIVSIINRSKKALPVQLLESGEYGGGSLTDRCISFSPKSEFVIGPKEIVSLQLIFNPTKRISQFSEDLQIRYAGVSRKLLNLSGKSQGVEISLDSDSLPFGVVVLDAQKVKKLTLENTGDISVTFHWDDSTFGKHFSILPLSGKVLPGNEITFDVIFKPQFEDEDIRQDGITLIIPGIQPLRITCTGSCIVQPKDSIQTLQFNSVARKAENKSVKIQNTTDKDWYLSPSLQGDDWKIPHEIKVPAKSSADLVITYFPLTMAKGGEGNENMKEYLFVFFIYIFF
jgi:hydrocephalus-inducing protein